MEAGEWQVIKYALGGLAGVFALLAASLAFWEAAQNEKHERTKGWFKGKWIGIRNSRWLSLPETTIKAVLGLKTYLRKIVGMDLLDIKWFGMLLFVSCLIFLPLGCFLTWGLYGGLEGLVFVLPGGLSALVRSAKFRDYRWAKKFRDWVNNLRKSVRLGYFFLLYGTTVVLITFQVLNMGIVYASIAMVVLVPVYWFYLVFPVVIVGDEYTNYNAEELYPFSMAIAASFTVTFLAMLVGHFADGSAWVPQTLQMLVSNVIFDGITMVVTLGLLSWAVAKRTMLRIPCAIVFDVIIAGLLACCSLYFGLVFTDRALSVGGVVNVLIGRSAGGEGLNLGPYFWTMHTTFLPTILYLSLILAAWMGKVVLVPVGWFFGIGHEHKSPLKLTATLLTLLSVMFGVMAYAAGVGQERCEQKEKRSTQDVPGRQVDAREGEGISGTEE